MGATALVTPLLAGLDPGRDFLDLAPDAKQIAAPDLRDLLFGVAPSHQFERHVEGFVGAVPAVDAAAAVEVRGDADVIDADQLDDIVDVVDEVLDGRARRLRVPLVDRGHTGVELRASIRRQREYRRIGTGLGGGHALCRWRAGNRRSGAAPATRAAPAAATTGAAAATRSRLFR